MPAELLIFGVTTLAYLIGAFFTTRSSYKAWRPYTVPLNCGARPGDTLHTHYRPCYRQEGGAHTDSEAQWLAFMMGLAWPAVLLVIAAVAGWDLLFMKRELPEEKSYRVAEKTKVLEIEAEKLRRDQEPED